MIKCMLTIASLLFLTSCDSDSINENYENYIDYTEIKTDIHREIKNNDYMDYEGKLIVYGQNGDIESDLYVSVNYRTNADSLYPIERTTEISDYNGLGDSYEIDYLSQATNNNELIIHRKETSIRDYCYNYDFMSDNCVGVFDTITSLRFNDTYKETSSITDEYLLYDYNYSAEFTQIQKDIIKTGMGSFETNKIYFEKIKLSNGEKISVYGFYWINPIIGVIKMDYMEKSHFSLRNYTYTLESSNIYLY